MAKHMRQKERTTKIQRRAANQKVLNHRLKGKGLYLFRNRSRSATLSLPKPAVDGRKEVGPANPKIPGSGEWQGDDYFMSLVPRDAFLIKEIKSSKEEKVEEKLILDQPNTVTTDGPVEHVVVKPEKKLNETPQQPKQKPSDVLINEDPMAGVTIVD